MEAALRAELVSVSQERDALRNALHETGHGAMESLAKAASQLARSEENRIAGEEEKEALAAAVASLQSDLKALAEAQVVGASGSEEEREAREARIRDLEAQVEDSAGEVEGLRSALLCEKHLALDALKQKEETQLLIQASQKASLLSTPLKNARETAQFKTQQVERLTKELREALEMAQGLDAERSVLMTAQESLSTRLAAAEEECGEMKSAFELSSEEAIHAEDKIGDLERDKAGLSGEVVILRQKLSELSLEISAAKMDLCQAHAAEAEGTLRGKDALAAMTATATGLTGKLAVAHASLAEAEADAGEAKVKARKLQASLEEAERKREEDSESGSQLFETLDQLNDKIESLTLEASQARAGEIALRVNKACWEERGAAAEARLEAIHLTVQTQAEAIRLEKEKHLSTQEAMAQKETEASREREASKAEKRKLQLSLDGATMELRSLESEARGLREELHAANEDKDMLSKSRIALDESRGVAETEIAISLQRQVRELSEASPAALGKESHRDTEALLSQLEAGREESDMLRMQVSRLEEDLALNEAASLTASQCARAETEGQVQALEAQVAAQAAELTQHKECLVQLAALSEEHVSLQAKAEETAFRCQAAELEACQLREDYSALEAAHELYCQESQTRLTEAGSMAEECCVELEEAKAELGDTLAQLMDKEAELAATKAIAEKASQELDKLRAAPTGEAGLDVARAERNEALRTVEDLKAVWEAELENTEMAMEQNRNIRKERDELREAFAELKHAAEAVEAQAQAAEDAAAAPLESLEGDLKEAVQRCKEAEKKAHKLERVATQLHTLGALRQILYLVIHPGSMLHLCFQEWKAVAECGAVKQATEVSRGVSRLQEAAGDQEAMDKALGHLKAVLMLTESVRRVRMMACSRCLHDMSRSHAEWKGARAVMTRVSPGARSHRGSKRVVELCDENAGFGSVSPTTGSKAISPASPSLTLSLSPSQKQNAMGSPSQPLVFDLSRN